MMEEIILEDTGQTFEELMSEARASGEDGHLYWEIIWVLAKRDDAATFERVFALTRGNAFERGFAARILGRFGAKIGTEERRFSQEIVNRLLEMLAVEKNENVLAAIVSALGHQVEDTRIPLALKGLEKHSNEGLRWNLALTLAHYETPEAIDMLIVLTRDMSSDVRDWATFGLGTQCDLDTPEIRAALAGRLSDEDEDTRAEAIFGLAKRHDRRAVDAIIKEFDDGFSGTLLFQALTETPDYRILPALREMAQSPKFPPNDPDIQAAITACEEYSKSLHHEN